MNDKSRIQERLDDVNEELYLLDDAVQLLNERIEELDDERRKLLSLLPHE